MIEFLPKVPPIFQTQLAFELDPTDMTATIATELLIGGASLSGLVCFSVDIGQPNPEYMIGTLSGNTFTITLRNIDPLDPTVSLGTFSSVHRQGAVVKITDFATIQLMRNILSGITPLQNPLISTAPAVNPTDVPNYSQLAGAIIAGGVPAGVGIMGISELSASPNVVLGNPTITIASPAVITLASHGLHANDIVKFTTTGALPTGIVAGTSYYVIASGLTTNAFEISATAGGAAINTTGSQSGTHTLTKITPVSVGTNDYRINGNNYGVSASGTDAYAITLANAPTAYIQGQTFSFKADVGNTNAATLNVNGLGAKTIKKLATTDLSTGDILAGQVIVVEYDGTNFQIVSVIPGLAPTVQTFLASGTYTKPAGVKSIVVQLWAAGGSGQSATGTNAGNAGGGGAYNTITLLGSAVGATETVTIGAGGAAVTNAAGNAGGNSSFGSWLTVFGGGGGANATNGGGGGGISGLPSSTGVGGAPNGGAISGGGSVYGGGGTGNSTTTTGGSSVYGGGGGGGDSGGNPGLGGNSYYGGGGGGGGGAGNAAGGVSTLGGNGGAGGHNGAAGPVAGSVPGGGGGGSDSSSIASAAGASGKLIVTEYY